MRSQQRCRASAFLLLAACLIFSGISVAAPNSVATVQTVSGVLTVRRDGSAAFVALGLNGLLSEGDVVHTGANSKAAILFTSGSQVRLNANTSIEVTAPVNVGHGKQSLFLALFGEVLARLRPGQAVQTRSAIAGVRGTVIHLNIDPDDTTTLTVVEGEVEFFNEAGGVVVEQSQQSTARPGVAPSAPVTVNNAGFIVEWTLDLDRALIPREKFFFGRDARLVAAELPRRAASAQAAPQNAQAQRDYGDVLFDSGRFDAALGAFQQANQLAPHQPETLSRLGDTLQELNQLDEAREAYQAALAAQTTPAVQAVALETTDAAPSLQSQPLVGLAWLELRHNRPAAAQTIAEQALSNQRLLAHAASSAPQTNAEARIALGLALMRQPGKLEAAAQTMQSALSAEPAAYGYQARAWLALIRMAQDDPAAALQEAQASIKEAPDSGLAHGNLALVYFYSGDAESAQREGQLAVRLSPKSVAARVALGQAMLARGDVDAATQTAAQAVVLDPDLPQARYLLGVADAGRRDYIHAARELEQATQLAPDFLPATAALARVYNGMGRQEQAVTLLQNLLPHHRSSDSVRAALGEVYYQQGKYAVGAEQYRQALKTKPQSALYNAQLARLLLDGNQLNEALVSARRAVQMAPEVGQYHAVLGLAYGYSGLRSQAEREFREALLRDPQNALALAQIAVRTADTTSGLAASGAGLRAAEAARSTQAFLLEPAISRQLLRGGINSEIMPSAGDEGRRDINFLNRANGADGRFNALSLFGRGTDDGRRLNDDSQSTNLEEYATFVTDPRTNLYVNLRGLRNSGGLSGPDLSPDTDDRSIFRFGQAQLAARHRLGADQFLWAGLFSNSLRSDVSNPGFNSFFDSQTGLPIGQQRLNSQALEPELRWDFGSRSKSSFTVGAARTHATFDSRRNLLVPIGSRTATDVFNESDRETLAYAQWRQTAGKRLSLVTQLRYQNRNRTGTRTFTNPGFPTLIGSDSQNTDNWLPSFLATYHPDTRTTLRLFANRRAPEVAASTFAPTETLLTTESTALPFGVTNDTMRLLQVDAERYLSPRDYLKFFAFRTTARNVQIGGANVLGFGGLPDPDAPSLALDKWRGSGAGLRYERQLGRSLFANAGVFLRSTSNLSLSPSGAAFSGGQAPYEPKRLATFELNHVGRKGDKLGLRMRHISSFFQDVPNEAARSVFPSRTYFDLLLSKEPSLSNEIFVNVLNVFDSSQVDFNGYNTGRRRIEFGVARRF